MKTLSYLKFSVLAPLLIAASVQAQDKVPLKTDLPPPLFVGTPVPYSVPNLEPAVTKWPVFMVPVGTTNLALNKIVTSSDSEPVVGTLDLVTDGDKDGDEGSWVELGPGKQWVQIDLAKEANISAVVVWHYHSQARVYHDVVVQVSDDPTFGTGVTTIYDNSASGTDHPYVETNFGKLIDAKGVKGRYVRLYSNGNTTNKLNHYIEVEVFGKPVA
jgi:F5/8 type C domain